MQAQIRQLQEQLAVEKDVWQENYRKKQDAQMMARERELQQRVKQARDAEIERVMQQLLTDNQQAIDECEREADKRIKYVSFISLHVRQEVSRGTAAAVPPPSGLATLPSVGAVP